jgi:hypothetical protein
MIPPPNNGSPGGGRPGGSRPGCPNVDPTFTALIPFDHVGETVSENPTFWLYVPYDSTIEFVLMDDATAEILHRQEFEVAGAPGIVGLTPTWYPPAVWNTDQVYRWRFDFYCTSSRRSAWLTAEGLIIPRVPPGALTHLSPSTAADAYASSGFWYDALTTVAMGLQANPTDATLLSDWQDLLTHPSVELDEFVDFIPLDEDSVVSSEQ